MTATDWFGYAGTFTSVTFMIPQIWRSIRTRHTRDLSWAMLGMLVLNSVLWLFYGLGVWSGPLIAANIISLMVQIVQCMIKVELEW